MLRRVLRAQPALVAFALAELALVVAALAVERPVFVQAVTSGDSWTYLTPAAELIGGLPLSLTRRTLGYPIFLALCEGLVPGGNVIETALVTQLVLNLVFIWATGRLILRIVPRCPTWALALAGLYVGLCGLDLALVILSDFLASLCFLASVTLLLAGTSGRSLLPAALLLGAATFVRPSFTAAPLLLVPTAWLLGRVGRRAAWWQWGLVAAMSGCATAGSIAIQHHLHGYDGPSDVVTFNIELLRVEAGTMDPTLPRDVPADPNVAEREARDALRLDVLARPARFASILGLRLLKYTFAPPEGTAAVIARLAGRPWEPRGWPRVALAVALLPFFALALCGPGRATPELRAYALFAWLWFLYFVGLGVMAPDQGERIRLPAVALLAPLVASNAQRWRDRWLDRARPVAATPPDQTTG